MDEISHRLRTLALAQSPEELCGW